MVSVLPEVPSFGKQFAQSVGGGVNRGISQTSDLAQKLAFEKYKRNLNIQQSLAEAGIEGEPSKGGTSQQPSVAQGPGTQSQGTSRILSDVEIENQAKQNLKNKASRGFETSLPNEIELLQKQKDRTISQRNLEQSYGARGEAALGEVMENAPTELRDYMAQKAQSYQSENLSDAELKKRLNTDAAKLKNEVASLRRSIPSARLGTKIKEQFVGKGRKQENLNTSIKNKIKPFLDRGMHSVVRAELADLGYGPEERESLISNLGESTRRNLNEFTKIEHPKQSPKFINPNLPSGLKNQIQDLPELSDDQRQKFSGNLKNVLKEDPATNLVLLRKDYEDKGVSWKEFKNQIDDMIANEELQLTPDQSKYLDILDQPPLDKLDKILYGLKLKGR